MYRLTQLRRRIHIGFTRERACIPCQPGCVRKVIVRWRRYRPGEIERPRFARVVAVHSNVIGRTRRNPHLEYREGGIDFGQTSNRRTRIDRHHSGPVVRKHGGRSRDERVAAGGRGPLIPHRPASTTTVMYRLTQLRRRIHIGFTHQRPRITCQNGGACEIVVGRWRVGPRRWGRHGKNRRHQQQDRRRHQQLDRSTSPPGCFAPVVPDHVSTLPERRALPPGWRSTSNGHRARGHTILELNPGVAIPD